MLVSLVICFITGLFLPMFVLGISISAKTRNERIIYYSILCVTLIVMRLIWGGTSKGINILLLIFILLFGVACYKAHDKVFSILGGIRNIISIYMEEVKKMSLMTTAGPINGESNGSVLNMKKILKFTLLIEAIIIICSIIGLYSGGQCLSIVIGTVAYIVVMHGFLLKDEALLGSIESIRRSTRVKLGLIDEGLPQPSEVADDDDDEDFEEGQSRQAVRKKKQFTNRGDVEETAIAGYIKERNKKEQADKVIKSIMDGDEDEGPVPVNKRTPSKQRKEDQRVIETVEKEELPLRRRPASSPTRAGMQYSELIDDEEEDMLGYKPKRTEAPVGAPKKRRLMQELGSEVGKERVQRQSVASTDQGQSNRQQYSSTSRTQSSRTNPTETGKNSYVDENGNTTIPRRGRLFSDD